MLPLWDLGMLSLEITFLLRGVTDDVINLREVGTGGMLDVSWFSGLFIGTLGRNTCHIRTQCTHSPMWMYGFLIHLYSMWVVIEFSSLLYLPLFLFSHFNVPHNLPNGFHNLVSSAFTDLQQACAMAGAPFFLPFCPHSVVMCISVLSLNSHSPKTCLNFMCKNSGLHLELPSISVFSHFILSTFFLFELWHSSADQ